MARMASWPQRLRSPGQSSTARMVSPARRDPLRAPSANACWGRLRALVQSFAGGPTGGAGLLRRVRALVRRHIAPVWPRRSRWRDSACEDSHGRLRSRSQPLRRPLPRMLGMWALCSHQGGTRMCSDDSCASSVVAFMVKWACEQARGSRCLGSRKVARFAPRRDSQTTRRIPQLPTKLPDQLRMLFLV